MTLDLLPTIRPAGDAALLVTFGDQIDLAANRRVHALAARLASAGFAGLGEPLPGIATLLVQYDPDQIAAQPLAELIRSFCAAEVETAPVAGRLVEIPAYYGGRHGPDLEFVAQVHGLSPLDVVKIHSQAEYHVFLLGFTPGFAYLGVVDERIATPRLESPRTRVKAGSVGIAGGMTGVYPLDTPGGWQIIAWTPVRLFDPAEDPPVRLAPGDRVRFVPVEGKEPADAAAGA